MLEKTRNALKIKEIRQRIVYMALAALLLRLGAQIPIPGIQHEYVKSMLEDIGFLNNGFLNAFTGGSFENMSVFALSITPYITASIIMPAK